MLGVAGALELFEERALVRLVRVELERQRPESDLLESAMDDFERRHLLGDEQHFLAARDGGGDDVGDRLRLARPGRPLDDERSPAGGLGDDDGLRTVGVDDMRPEEHTSELQSLMRISYAA